jgi:3-oxoacyl-[acyl-carrier protein] reductase
MDLGITGKWALVCGASKGLGLGCAQALVREGVHVLIVARGVEALQAATAKLTADKARPAGASVQLWRQTSPQQKAAPQCSPCARTSTSW